MDFIDGGAEDELTIQQNRQALQQLRFIPGVLTDVSTRNQETQLLGTPGSSARSARHTQSPPAATTPALRKRGAYLAAMLACGQRPVNRGDRFSRKAVNASSMSSVRVART